MIMKTLHLFKFITLLALLILIFSGCKKDDDDNNDNQTQYRTLSGEWEFTLSPLESFQDTSTIHGLSATDYEEYPATFSEVYLYENNNDEIKGQVLGYQIRGTRNEGNVQLDLYVYPDGAYDEFMPVDSMTLFSSMELQLDEFGLLKGTGSYTDYPDYPNIIYDTYEVSAMKINDITIPYKESKGWTDKICEVVSKFDSFLISTLTANIFRPMNGCYGQKDGGGYYVFGHEGPGNMLPIYTTTLYFPVEWSWCKVRNYGFSFDLKGEVWSYAKLKEEIDKMDEALKVFEKWGYNDGSEYFDDLDDFVDSFGGFAISILFDSHTHNIGLFVNHESGNKAEVRSHPIIEKLSHELDKLGGTVYVYSGKDIGSHWHLRRSDFLVCNSQIYIIYLIGTHKVYYN